MEGGTPGKGTVSNALRKTCSSNPGLNEGRDSGWTVRHCIREREEWSGDEEEEEEDEDEGEGEGEGEWKEWRATYTLAVCIISPLI